MFKLLFIILDVLYVQYVRCLYVNLKTTNILLYKAIVSLQVLNCLIHMNFFCNAIMNYLKHQHFERIYFQKRKLHFFIRKCYSHLLSKSSDL